MLGTRRDGLANHVYGSRCNPSTGKLVSGTLEAQQFIVKVASRFTLFYKADCWLETKDRLKLGLCFNLPIPSSFLPPFPSFFTRLRTWQPQNKVRPLRAFRRWVEPESNADWFSGCVRMSVNSNRVTTLTPPTTPPSWAWGALHQQRHQQECRCYNR
jgi:hypothetical protein